MLILTFAPIPGLITAFIIKWEPIGKDVEKKSDEKIINKRKL